MRGYLLCTIIDHSSPTNHSHRNQTTTKFKTSNSTTTITSCFYCCSGGPSYKKLRSEMVDWVAKEKERSINFVLCVIYIVHIKCVLGKYYIALHVYSFQTSTLVPFSSVHNYWRGKYCMMFYHCMKISLYVLCCFVIAALFLKDFAFNDEVETLHHWLKSGDWFVMHMHFNNNYVNFACLNVHMLKQLVYLGCR